MNLTRLLRSRTTLKALRDGIIHEGIRGLLSNLLWVEGGFVYRRLLLMERSLDDPIPEIITRVRLVFDQLRESEIVEYLAFRPESDPSKIRSLLRHGHLCFVARNAALIVSANWVTTSSTKIIRSEFIPPLERELKLAQDEVYQSDAFTAPHLLGQHIYRALVAWMLRRCRDLGFRRIIADVRPDNKASIRALNAVGYRQFGDVGYLKVGSWRWNFVRIRK